jgi:hypothetical protein
MRHGEYPPPRGACLSLGERRYLYTTGYVPYLGRYPRGHVPTPVQITDHVGDSDAQALLAEVLLMTKMNWNSARFAENSPSPSGSPTKSALSSATSPTTTRPRHASPSTCNRRR